MTREERRFVDRAWFLLDHLKSGLPLGREHDLVCEAMAELSLAMNPPVSPCSGSLFTEAAA